MTEDQKRFKEIMHEISILASEARDLLPESVLARANAYWYMYIISALNNDNEFMGGSMCNMQDTLEEWQEMTGGSYSTSGSYQGFMSQEDEYDWDLEAGRPAHMRDEDWN